MPMHMQARLTSPIPVGAGSAAPLLLTAFGWGKWANLTPMHPALAVACSCSPVAGEACNDGIRRVRMTCVTWTTAEVACPSDLGQTSAITAASQHYHQLENAKIAQTAAKLLSVDRMRKQAFHPFRNGMPQ